MSLNSDRGAAKLWVWSEHLDVLRERKNWLTERIKAKQTVGWETQWDERERNALEWALHELMGPNA